MGQMAQECKRQKGTAMLEGSCLCGACGWRLAEMPVQATICNCRACHRYGAVWAYGNRCGNIEIFGSTNGFVRADSDGDLAFHTCPTCGVLHSWRPVRPDGAVYRMAVNLRLSSQDAIASLPLRRFDGRKTWTSRPDDGCTVAAIWA